MKNAVIMVAMGFFLLFLGGLINSIGASGKNQAVGVDAMLEAIEHAEEAKTHKAHPNHMHDHAKESLEQVKKAEMDAYEHGREEGKIHITQAIQHLVEAIKHADMGHSRIAGEHLEDALMEMRSYVNQ